MNTQSQSIRRAGNLSKLIPSVAALAFIFLTAVAADAADTDDIRALLAGQVTAWNRGDLAGFVQGFARVDRVRIATCDVTKVGWNEIRTAYSPLFQDASAMGTLSFSDIEIDPLTSDLAYVFLRSKLQTRVKEHHGVASVLVRKTADGWKIIVDHSSSDAGC
ncbi:MAG: nuclear transport factor 2 family protein [Hyphomicrobiales bacterium]|nr:nuclear transport factor 2 family protein [Hyphomicrobiales bacterium]MBV8823731.1 nuclear transport factor 2 family protein [Hyphomicrobiales bacterium]